MTIPLILLVLATEIVSEEPIFLIEKNFNMAEHICILYMDNSVCCKSSESTNHFYRVSRRNKAQILIIRFLLVWMKCREGPALHYSDTVTHYIWQDFCMFTTLLEQITQPLISCKLKSDLLLTLRAFYCLPFIFVTDQTRTTWFKIFENVGSFAHNYI